MKTSLILVLLLTLGLMADGGCGGGDGGGDGDADSDTDTDSDTDSDADGDFPGDCGCRARFTLDGNPVDICGEGQYCRCELREGGDEMMCFISASDSSFSIQQIKTVNLGPGADYSSWDSALSTMLLGVDQMAYLSPEFHIHFEKWDGEGGIASGTFTATVAPDNDLQTTYDITDGEFYAPINPSSSK